MNMKLSLAFGSDASSVLLPGTISQARGMRHSLIMNGNMQADGGVAADDASFWRSQDSFERGTMDAYTAAQLVAAVRRGNAQLPDAEAHALCDRLVARGYFVPIMRRGDVARLVQRDRLQDDVFYSVAAESDWRCLNGQCRAQREGAGPFQAAAVGAKLRRGLLTLHGEFVTAAGVDYRRMRESPLFHAYRVAALDLQLLDLAAMAVEFRAKPEEGLAFFLNIYNSLVIHATIQVGSPQGFLQRYAFFSKISYLMGGHKFTMNDLEHGVLRGNRTGPGSLFAQFRRNDPRLALSLETVDPRIHFALNCGAKSCPPIRVYAAQNIERGLQLAAEGFLRDTVRYDAEARTVTVSQIVSWYRRDFPERDEDLVAWIASFLDEAHPLREAARERRKLKFVYAPYDWSQNEAEVAEGAGAVAAVEEPRAVEDAAPGEAAPVARVDVAPANGRVRGELVVNGERVARPPDADPNKKTMEDLAEALQITSL